MPAPAYHTTSHSPVALYQFDGDMTDSSGNGYDLSLYTGTERYADVVPGLRGFYFDGSTELRLMEAALTSITGDMTLEYLVVFARTVGSNSEQSPVHPALEEDELGNSAINYTWYLSFVGTALAFRWFQEWDDGQDSVPDQVNYPHPKGIGDGLLVGVPYHVAVVRENDVVQFYLNGNPLGPPSSTLTTAQGGGGAWFVVGGEGGVDRFKGVLASVKIVTSALTANEIRAEYEDTIGDALETNTKHTTAHSPIALWQFDDDLTDSSGNGYDLSLATGYERYTELAPGVRGALLDGGTILSRVYTAALKITGDLTVECGFVPGVWTNPQDLIRFGGGTGQANNTCYALRVNGQSHYLSYLAEYGSSTPKTTSTHAVNDGLVVGTLYHLALRRESNVISFFINGRLISSASGTLTAPDGGTTGLMKIGYSGSEVVGGITSVKIIDSALTDAEIKTEATSFFTP